MQGPAISSESRIALHSVLNESGVSDVSMFTRMDSSEAAVRYKRAMQDRTLPIAHRTQCMYLSARLATTKPSVCDTNPHMSRRNLQHSKPTKLQSMQEFAKKQTTDQLAKNVKAAESPYSQSKMRFPQMAQSPGRPRAKQPQNQKATENLAMQFYNYACDKLQKQTFDTLQEACDWFCRLYGSNTDVCGKEIAAIVTKQLAREYDSNMVFRRVQEFVAKQ